MADQPSQNNIAHHQELLMLYKNSVDHIERIKQRQWSEFYSVVIGQAGLVGVFKNTAVPFSGSVHCYFRIVLLLLTLLGLFLILFEQIHLHGTRHIIKNSYRPRLSSETVKMLDDIDKGDYLGSFMQWLYPVVLTIVLIVVFSFFWIIMG
jgi:hypothetical protein